MRRRIIRRRKPIRRFLGNAQFRIKRTLGLKVPSSYVYKQIYPATNLGQSNGAAAFNTINWTLSSAQNESGFLALYDQYRFRKVELVFRPLYTSNSQSAAATSGTPPLIYTVIDYDDGNNATTISELQQYQTCKVHQYENFKITLKPHVNMGTYNGSNFNSSTNAVNQWVDCASDTVVWYGVKTGIDAGTSSTLLQVWHVTTTVWLEFRNVR